MREALSHVHTELQVGSLTHQLLSGSGTPLPLGPPMQMTDQYLLDFVPLSDAFLPQVFLLLHQIYLFKILFKALFPKEPSLKT